MFDFAESFAQRLPESAGPAELTARFAEHVGRLGIDDFGYAEIDAAGQPIRATSLTTWSDEFLSYYYGNQIIEIDPTYSLARRQTAPFLWSRAVDRRTLDRATLQAMDDSAAMGLADGITLSIRGPERAVAVVDMTVRSRRSAIGVVFETHLTELYLAALELHAVMADNAIRRRLIAPGFFLTDREAECFRWLARGKSTWEISRILGITERTVVFHVGNVKRKLGTGSRIQALVALVRAGIIEP